MLFDITHSFICDVYSRPILCLQFNKQHVNLGPTPINCGFECRAINYI